MEVSRSDSGVSTPITSVVPSSVRKAVVHSRVNPADSVWKSIFSCAAWPWLAAGRGKHEQKEAVGNGRAKKEGAAEWCEVSPAEAKKGNGFRGPTRLGAPRRGN